MARTLHPGASWQKHGESSDSVPKFEAIIALAGPFDVYLSTRHLGNWYVHARIEIGGDGVLSSPNVAGRTPEEAVNKYWDELLAVPLKKYIVINAMNANRRNVRWNGFMWADVPIEKATP